jgi:2-amino-4-hydroxy-6-hydroxymethyldihydropteridine diphosphokinase
MNRVIVSLGSNINKENNIPLALAFLHENCRVTAVSPIYETIPVGLRDQPNFYNLAVQIETDLEALTFKETVLERLESHLKRTRQANPNAPRTIDADITLFNDEVFDYGREGERQRHIPDPDLLKFAHVAVPVAGLLPDLPHPETGEPLRQLAARLRQEAVDENGRPALWRSKK